MGLRRMLYEEGKQEGKEEGMIIGLYEAIEVGFFIKFGDDGMKLMNKVREIKDLRRLKAVTEAVKTIESINDMRNRIET